MMKIDETTKIDKLILKNIRITHIDDMSDLIGRHILRSVVSDDTDDVQHSAYVTESGQTFEHIHIKDDGMINSLKCGVSGVGMYCKLQISVQKKNIYNLESNSHDEYVEQIQRIQTKLIDDYGIYTDFSSCSVDQIEVNRTFAINDCFSAYDRVLNLIVTEMPRMNRLMEAGVKDASKAEKPMKIETFYAKSGKNATKTVKIYDKSEQLKCKIELDQSFMRFEITLKGSKHINRAFKTDLFFQMTQSVINDWFRKQIETLVVKPMDKWRKNNIKYLKMVLNEELLKSGSWQINALRRFANDELNNKKAYLLDVNDLMPIIDGMKINRKNRTKERFREQAERYESVFCHGDSDKLKEVIEKLTATDDVSERLTEIKSVANVEMTTTPINKGFEAA